MKPAVNLAIGMGFISGIDDGPALHGIDALQLEEEVAALADLESRLEKLVFILPAKFARAAHDLAGDQEGHKTLAERLP